MENETHQNPETLCKSVLVNFIFIGYNNSRTNYTNIEISTPHHLLIAVPYTCVPSYHKMKDLHGLGHRDLVFPFLFYILIIFKKKKSNSGFSRLLEVMSD